MLKRASLLALLLASLAASGCDDKAVGDGNKPPAGMSRQQAALVLAKVGSKTITVGDLAAALERLGDIDRLRYQTPEKRKDLLQELIDIELLAQEAKRRGMDKEPAVQEGIRQILREAMRAKALEGLPAPADISAGDVAGYYEAHKSDFEDPERRRVSAIVLGDPAHAAELLAKAVKIDNPKQWGEMYFEHSLDAPKERDPHAPADLAGDLGLVGPPGHSKGANERVPEPVRKAAFEMSSAGEVYPKPVQAGERYYLVRLVNITKGHSRTLAESDRLIRTAILQDLARKRESKLGTELRQRFPVRIDDAALSVIEFGKGDPMFELGKGDPMFEPSAPATAGHPHPATAGHPHLVASAKP